MTDFQTGKKRFALHGIERITILSLQLLFFYKNIVTKDLI